MLIVHSASKTVLFFTRWRKADFLHMFLLQVSVINRTPWNSLMKIIRIAVLNMGSKIWGSPWSITVNMFQLPAQFDHSILFCPFQTSLSPVYWTLLWCLAATSHIVNFLVIQQFTLWNIRISAKKAIFC